MIWVALSALTYIVGFALIILIVMQRKSPSSSIAWILAIVFLPIVGSIIYLWFGFGRIAYRVKRRRKSDQKIADDMQKIDQALTAFHIIDDDGANVPVQQELIAVTTASNGFAVTHGNAITLHADSGIAFQHLLSAIAHAEESVNLQYYIFRNDEAGRTLRDALIAAAKRGATVRILVDGVGSWSLPWSFFRLLKKEKGRAARYLPVTPLGRPWHWNLRNHRKATIIDGRIGFIGSANIGNEYCTHTGKISDFDDVLLKCKGPVVQQLQEVFASDWFFATNENLFNTNAYFPLPERSGNVLAQVVESGPTGPSYTLHDMLCSAVHAATKSVHILTPFFIPDQALIVSLRTAALRGIDVKIITARQVPSWEKIIYIAGRSFYEDLLSVNVKIYEYLPAFLHIKGIVVDGYFVSIGTANMDMRSFFLNFEVNMNLYSREIAVHLEQIFESRRQQSEEIILTDFAKRSSLVRLLENSSRVFSPIL
ncbi:MAG TPA: cardiolipin synthase [Candidatus Peribacterales bacterium]|nr:cardiolipin synthase [Candidatus Peribacterales bacterium]